MNERGPRDLKTTKRDRETILLVDNGPERADIVLALARCSYTVILADDGPSALALIREDSPLDLVIVADETTGFDGISFLTDLRRRAPALPAIMLSALGSIERECRGAEPRSIRASERACCDEGIREDRAERPPMSADR